MGKIDKTSSSRHMASMSPAISKFIQKATSLPLRELPDHLDSFPRIWFFTRGDLYHWIPVLNRFDSILELFVREYGLDQGPQSKPFGTIIQEQKPDAAAEGDSSADKAPLEEQTANSTVDDRQLILSILSFTRMLLDSCSNRILYSSKEHINSLFSSTDQGVVVAALKIGLQIARRYHDLRMKSPHSFMNFGLDIDNLYRLSMPFARFSSPALGDPGRFQDGVVNSSNLLAVINDITPENAHLQTWAHVHVPSREKRAISSSDHSKSNNAPPLSPSPASRRQPSEPGHQHSSVAGELAKQPSSHAHMHIPMSEINSAPTYEIIRKYIHLVPKENQFDFLHRLNIAKAVMGSVADREGIVATRLLAIAILAYAEKESAFVYRLGQPDGVEPRAYQIPFQLCNLLQRVAETGRGVSLGLQTVAINTLEALCFQASKHQDLYNALMVSQSHGPLFILIRTVIDQLAAGTGGTSKEDVEAERWRDSFLVLLGEVPALTSTHTVDHLVNAGIMPPLIEILHLRTIEALRSQPRVLIFLDNLMYSARDAFAAFADNRGLEAIAELAKFCVDSSLERVEAGEGFDEEYASSLTEYKIPYFNQQVIKWLLKFTIHRMSSHDTSDARYLRNLMDIPAFLHSLRVVISNGKIFGAMIWSWAANVLHVFINNEPTSYSVVAEAGLSKGLVESVLARQLSGSDVTWQNQDVSGTESGTDSGGAAAHGASEYFKPTMSFGWFPAINRRTIRIGREVTEEKPLAQGILHSSDVMATIPDVLSTFCLNEGGMKMIKNSGVIPAFFEIFESLEHVRSLDGSPNNTTSIGRSLDHFVRHHPSLQFQIFDALHSVIFNLNQLLLEEVLVSGRGTRLLVTDQAGDSKIAGGRRGLLGPVGIARIQNLIASLLKLDHENSLAEELRTHLSNMMAADSPLELRSPLPSNQDEGNNVLFATSFFRSAFGFFSRAENCSIYLKRHGIRDFLTLVLHPAFGPSFNYRLRDQLSVLDNKPTRILKTLAFHKPHLVLPSIFGQFRDYFKILEPLVSYREAGPFFQPFISKSMEGLFDAEAVQIGTGTNYVKTLQNLYTLSMTFSTLFQDAISNRQTAQQVVNFNAADQYAEIIEHLMAIQSSCLWEDLVLQPSNSARWTKVCRMMPGEWVFVAPRILGLVEYQDLEGWKELSSKLLAWQDSDEARFGSESSVGFQNYSVIRYLLTNVVSITTPLLYSLLRLISQNRSTAFDDLLVSRLFPLISAVASGFVAQLRFAQTMRVQNPEAFHPYLAVILRSLYLVVFGDSLPESPSAKYLRATMTCRFKDEGGFTILLSILQDLVENGYADCATVPDTAAIKDHPVEHSIQNILLFCYQAASLTNFGYLFGNPSDTRFNFHRYSMEIRLMLLDVCFRIWPSDDTKIRRPRDTIRNFLTLMQALFKAKVDRSHTLPYNTEEGRLEPPKMRYARVVSKYEALEEKYGEELALEALYRCNDDAVAAEEYCEFLRSGAADHMPIPDLYRQEYVATDSRVSQSFLQNLPCVPPSPPADDPSSVVPFAELQDTFEKKKNEIRLEFPTKIPSLLLDYGAVEFDVSRLVLCMVPPSKDDSDFASALINSLIQTLLSMKVSGASAIPARDARKIAATSHLLGLILRESTFFDLAVHQLKEHFDDLVSYISIVPVEEGEEPVLWIAHILLVMESLLSHDAVPPKAAIPWIYFDSGSQEYKKGSTPSPEPIVPFLSDVQKHSLLDAILAVLPKLNKDELTNLSVIRVLAFLSRRPSLAAVLGEKHNIRKLFLLVRQMNGAHQEQFKVVFLLILRHIVEDKETIRQIMRAQLLDGYYGMNPPSAKTTDLVNTRMQTILREPETFIELASEMFTFAKFEGPNSSVMFLRGHYFNQPQKEIKLLREEMAEELKTEIKECDPEYASYGDLPEDEPMESKSIEPKTPVPAKTDGVVHYLLCELLAYKDVKETVHKEKTDSDSKQKETDSAADSSSSGQPDQPAAPAEAKPEEFVPSDHSVYLYRCFLLQCLTELLLSYNKAKAEFIYFSRKAEQHSLTPSKHHSRVLSYLLNTLIPVGTVAHASDFETRKRVVLSSWAIQVIVALCSKTGEVPPVRKANAVDVEKSVEPELTHIRRIVLDQVQKSFKEVHNSGESSDYSYSRLLGLGDLVNRLITKQFAPASSQTFYNVLSLQHSEMVKLMHERNFAATLASATTDIDMNFPDARRAVKYLLRPLKHLSQLSMQLAMDGKLSAPSNSQDDDALSSSEVSEVSDMREETPDLYRNSTLGVLDPADGDEGSEDSDEMEDDDENMYDEEYDDEMDYDDEPLEDDEGMSEDEEMGPIEGLPGDVPMNIDVAINGSHDGSSDDMSDEESDEDSDDDDLSEDMEPSDDELDDDIEITVRDFAGGELDSEGEYGADDEDWIDADELEEESLEFAGEAFTSHDRRNAGSRDAAMYIPNIPTDDDDDDGSGSRYFVNSLLPDEHRPLGGSGLAALDGDHDDLEDPLEPNLFEDHDDDDDDDDDEAGYVHGHVHSHSHGHGHGHSHTHGHGHDHEHTHDIFHIGLDTFRHLPSHQPLGADSIHYHLSRLSSLPGGGHTGSAPPYFFSGPLEDSGSREDALTHPLAPNSGVRSAFTSAGFGLPTPSPFGPDAHMSVESMGPLMTETPITMLNHILSFLRNVPLLQSGAFGNSPHVLNLNANAVHVSMGPGLLTGDPAQTVEISYPTPRNDPEHIVHFTPARTNYRWEEEYKLIFSGKLAADKAIAVLSRAVNEMIPFSLRHRTVLERIRRKLKEEENAKMLESLAEGNNDSASQAVATAPTTASPRPAASAVGQAQPAERLEGENADESETRGANEADGDEDVEDAEGDEDEDEEADDDEDEDEDDDDEDEDEQDDSHDDHDNAAPSEPVQRVTVPIRGGRQIDITGLGIDVDYLLALPEELREEVVMQEMAQRRRRAPPTVVSAPPELSSIDPEFLNALPPGLREEVLEQEARDRRRREREEERRQQQAQPSAEEGASTTLPPRLGEADGLLNALPPQFRNILLSGPDLLSPGSEDLNESGSRLLPVPRPPPFPVDSSATRDTLQKKTRLLPQLLDKAGVASLLRFMFLPMQGTARQSLDDILRHICLSRPTRVEVLTTLLTILQDGSVNVSSLDYSFSQLSLRAKSQCGSRSPHPSRRTTSAMDLPDLDISPLMVIQQCLRTLSNLTKENNRLCMFFFTEHESGGLRIRHGGRKGKCAEPKGAKYPINALLGLLESPIIMDSSPVIEQLASLLQFITIPLGLLFKRGKELQESKPAEAAESASGDGDVPMLDPPSLDPGSSSRADSTTVPAAKDKSTAVTASKEPQMPEIPEHNLRLVVKIIVTGECGSLAFRDTLSLITNLSSIPGAKDIFGQELISHAVSLGQVILKDLTELLAQIKEANSGSELHSAALAKFTPATSDQARLLRIILSLDYVFDPTRVDRNGKLLNAPDGHEKGHILMSIFDMPIFTSMWARLDECLTTIRVKEMLNVATVLLPLIEVLMVAWKNTTLKDAPLGRAESRDDGVSTPGPRSSTDLESLFFGFTEEHRKVLNELVRSNPKLMSGSFSLLVKNCKVLEFDNKRNYFTRELHNRSNRPANLPGTLNVSVRRDQVFLDSFKALNFKSADEIKYSKLNIQFSGEAGVDAGGVSREWFQVLSKQMFNPDYALFIHASADSTIFHPNVHSGVNHEHLMYFRFIGRIIGKAIFENRLLDCHFSRAVYKRMLGKSVSLKDLESLDLDYYKSLVWMLENDITDVITETFSTTSDQFGVLVETDLIENGRNVPVTEDNKHDYVRAIVEHKLVGAVKEQLDAFLKGFHEIIPMELISIFNEQELELLISGLPDINVDDWKNNTSYQNYTFTSPQIQWFWRAVRSFDKEERAKLLQFVTGTSKVPLNGFKELEGMSGFAKFSIHRDYGSTDRLPSAHTCFNQLDLPEYESYEKLRQQLYTAFTAGNEYFAFA